MAVRKSSLKKIGKIFSNFLSFLSDRININIVINKQLTEQDDDGDDDGDITELDDEYFDDEVKR